ncbi:MAG: rhodanese-like domain-containing protein [Chromatiales bacterium]|nr:rhodanese-like domain-containing protein [Chromatiales bacterium]
MIVSELTKSIKDLLAEAMNNVAALEIDEAKKLVASDHVQFVDVRDPNEWATNGMIKNAIGASRGMLEFMADPDSPYHNPAFSHNKQLILYCAKGPRSALAAWSLKQMGFEKVCYLGGGFNAWLDADGETVYEE